MIPVLSGTLEIPVPLPTFIKSEVRRCDKRYAHTGLLNSPVGIMINPVNGPVSVMVMTLLARKAEDWPGVSCFFCVLFSFPNVHSPVRR
jgi:hypothetical protein